MSLIQIKASKLVLGTAQFGFDYGIANQSGRISIDEGKKILTEARGASVNTLDTAIAYGNSELVLGEIGVANWNIITKLPKIPDEITNVDGWVEAQILDSLARLKIRQLEGLLLHYPAQIFTRRGSRLSAALENMKAQGLVRKIGVSIYGPDELPRLLDAFDVDLIQSPLSILDRRLIDSGWLERLMLAGVEVHVRSVFLQGLLLMSDRERPENFLKWQPLWVTWRSWLKQNNLLALDACLRFALNINGVSKVVVGVDSLSHLKQILAAPSMSLQEWPKFEGLYDERVINPSRWEWL